MAVHGIAGLPGSGKSNLTKQLRDEGFAIFNDINRDWNSNLPNARAAAQGGRDVVISDIMFCHESWRERLERELVVVVEWTFFANDPWQCAKNCLFRFMFEKPYRPLQQEIQKIQELSPVYTPNGPIHPVVRADKDIPL